MKSTLIPLALALLALTACMEEPSEAVVIVADARAEVPGSMRAIGSGRRAVDEQPAHRGPAMAAVKTREQEADAEYGLIIANAAIQLDIDEEQCEASAGDARGECKDMAEEIHDKVVAYAGLRRIRALHTAVPAEGLARDDDR